MDDSLGSSLELLGFFLINSNDYDLLTLSDVSLFNKDNKLFNIYNIQQRIRDPLVTLIDESGTEKLYSAKTLKEPYWLKADISQEVLDLLKEFYESVLKADQVKLHELEIKRANIFQKAVEDALEKHRKILESNATEYKGFSRLEGAYFSHCYKCKKPVNNKSNYMCNACNRLICNRCGNCKCLFVNLN